MIWLLLYIINKGGARAIHPKNYLSSKKIIAARWAGYTERGSKATAAQAAIKESGK